MGRRSGDPYPYVGNPQMEGISQAQRFFPRSEESEAQMGFPSLGILNWKDKPLEYTALKN